MTSRLTKPIFSATHTGPVHRGTVIFLHGTGDTGPDLWKLIQHICPEFQPRHLKFVLPTAPKRQYTPIGGEITTAWFDRKAISRSCNEIIESVDEIAVDLVEIVNEEVQAGTPLNHIIIGGFSMGGAMAMHLGFRYLTDIAGTFALSSFFTDDSALHQIKPNEVRMPPHYQWHGARDKMVPLSWGLQSFTSLQELGVSGEFHVSPNALHELPRDCLIKLKGWIEKRIPDVKPPKI